MPPRIKYTEIAPAGCKVKTDLEPSARRHGREATRREPIKSRAWQINGSAFCLDRHNPAAAPPTKSSGSVTAARKGSLQTAVTSRFWRGCVQCSGKNWICPVPGMLRSRRRDADAKDSPVFHFPLRFWGRSAQNCREIGRA